MMIKRVLSPLLLAGCVVLAGCDSVKQDLGIGAKQAPDEFMTYSRAPLSLPPDYGLRPPATATAASQAAAPRESARQAMLGNSNAAAPAASGTSPGLRSLLDRTGGATASSDIRAQVNRETTILADADESFVERMMFWTTPEERATVVDPASEQRRIQQNQAMDRPITDGETPTIRRKPRALLEGIFD